MALARPIAVLCPCAAAVLLSCLAPAAALAHDCSSAQDCLQTAGFNATLGIVGGMIALISWIISNSLLPATAPGAAVPAGGEPAEGGGEPVPATFVDGTEPAGEVGYVVDAAGNRWVREPTGAGFSGGYSTVTVIDPATGIPVTVVDPNSVAITKDVQVPAVDALPTTIYSGQQAVNILEQTGMVVRIRNPDGSFTWQPRPGFDNLLGGQATVRTGEATDPATGEVVGSQTASIPRINGVAYSTIPPDDPNGAIDPNSIAIVVSQGPSGDRLGNVGQWNDVTHPQPDMEVEGTTAFVNQVTNDLNTIRGTPTGRQTLDGLAASGQQTSIVQVPPGSGNSAASHHPLDAFANGAPGAGTPISVGYDNTSNSMGDGTQPWHARPPHVGLHHELVHALHATTGQMQAGSVNDPLAAAAGVNIPIPQREAQATGIGPFAGTSPTDNSYRTDLGLPTRPTYLF
jgi:hypothetical protein